MTTKFVVEVLEIPEPLRGKTAEELKDFDPEVLLDIEDVVLETVDIEVDQEGNKDAEKLAKLIENPDVVNFNISVVHDDDEEPCMKAHILQVLMLREDLETPPTMEERRLDVAKGIISRVVREHNQANSMSGLRALAGLAALARLADFGTRRSMSLADLFDSDDLPN